MATIIRSVWTRPQLLEQIELYKEAAKAVAFGQSYTIGSRQLTRLDLSKIKDWLEYLESELAALDNGGTGPKMVQGRIRSGANCPCRRIRAW